MSSNRWFDFGSRARIDLVDRRDDIPLLRLRVAAPATPAVVDAARLVGWVAYDTRQDFDHYADIRSLKGYADLLRPFFSDAEILAALTTDVKTSTLEMHSADLAPQYVAASSPQERAAVPAPAAADISEDVRESEEGDDGLRISRLSDMARARWDIAQARRGAITAAIPILRAVHDNSGERLGWTSAPHAILERQVEEAFREYDDMVGQARAEREHGELALGVGRDVAVAADQLAARLGDELERAQSYLEFAHNWLAAPEQPAGLEPARRSLELLAAAPVHDPEVVPLYRDVGRLEEAHFAAHLASIYGDKAGLIERMSYRFGLAPAAMDGMLWSEVEAAERHLIRDEAVEAYGSDLAAGDLSEVERKRLAGMRAAHDADDAGFAAVEQLSRGEPRVVAYARAEAAPLAASPPASRKPGVSDMISTLPASRQANILAKIETAKKAMGLLRGPAPIPFGNGALAVWDTLRRHGDDVFAMSAVAQGLVMLRSGDPEFRTYEDRLLQIAEGGRDPAWLEKHIEPEITVLCRRTKTTVDQLDGIMSPDRIWVQAMTQFGQDLALTVFDGAISDPAHVPGTIRSFVGLDDAGKLSAVHLMDKQLPDTAVLDTRRRLAVALDFMSRKIGFSGEDRLRQLLNGDNVNILLSRRASLDQRVHGAAASSDRASSVRLSPYQPFAAIHEIGHVLDYRRRESVRAMPAWLTAMLEGTGVIDSTRRIVDAALPILYHGETEKQERQRAYYLDPAEVFARSVTAGVSTALHPADKFARGAGGMFAMPLGVDYEPQAHVAATFLKEWADKARRDYEMDNSRSLAASSVVEPAF